MFTINVHNDIFFFFAKCAHSKHSTPTKQNIDIFHFKFSDFCQFSSIYCVCKFVVQQLFCFPIVFRISFLFSLLKSLLKFQMQLFSFIVVVVFVVESIYNEWVRYSPPFFFLSIFHLTKCPMDMVHVFILQQYRYNLSILSSIFILCTVYLRSKHILSPFKKKQKFSKGYVCVCVSKVTFVRFSRQSTFVVWIKRNSGFSIVLLHVMDEFGNMLPKDLNMYALSLFVCVVETVLLGTII